MDKKLIFSEGYNKYYRVSLPDETSNSGNTNFDKLLFLLGHISHIVIEKK